MTALVPYPVLFFGLVIMWLLLGGFTPGQLVLAVLVSAGAVHALGALGEARPVVRSWRAMFKLIGIVTYDIVRSNIAVARILITGKRPHSGYVQIPLRVESPAALAILSIVLTSTPGTAWLDYNSARSELLIHVFDLVDPEEWVELIGTRYERLLLEIFE